MGYAFVSQDAEEHKGKKFHDQYFFKDVEAEVVNNVSCDLKATRNTLHTVVTMAIRSGNNSTIIDTTSNLQH